MPQGESSEQGPLSGTSLCHRCDFRANARWLANHVFIHCYHFGCGAYFKPLIDNLSLLFPTGKYQDICMGKFLVPGQQWWLLSGIFCLHSEAITI